MRLAPLLVATLALVAGGCGTHVANVRATGEAPPDQRMERVPAPLPVPPRVDAAAADVPEGYRVEVVVSDLTYPTSVDVDEEGNLYVAEGGWIYGDEAAPCRIWRFGPEGEGRIIADGLQAPVSDLLWHLGRLYISEKGNVSVWEGGARHDLVTGLPSLGDHQNGQLAAGPDGRIYVGQGTATNSGVVGVDNFVFGWLRQHPEVHDVPARDLELRGANFVSVDPRMLTSRDHDLARTGAFQRFGESGAKRVQGAAKANGTILAFAPDGSGLAPFCWGLRNPFGVCWAGEQLWAADNGYDDRGSRAVADAPDVLWRIRRDAWYGWPDFVAGIPITDPRFRAPGKDELQFLLREHPPVEQPFATLPTHVGVAKLDVAPTGGTFGHEGALFLARFGDMRPVTGNGTEAVGHDVVRIDPRSGKVERFLHAEPGSLGKGAFAYVETPGPRRPVDVRFHARESALYVVDLGAIAVLPTASPMVQPYEGSGAVWRITRTGTETTVRAGRSILVGRGTGGTQAGAAAPTDP